MLELELVDEQRGLCVSFVFASPLEACLELGEPVAVLFEAGKRELFAVILAGARGSRRRTALVGA
jgi:hypothetical protein